MIGVGDQVGSYRVQKLLGKGGMGQVFVAEHVRLGRPVALKVLLPHCSADPELVARFFAEARAVNRIRHEHIVEVTDDGTTADQQAFYVMELLEGESLAGRLGRMGRLPPAQAAAIVLQIADALAATHAAGIIHRDLKPDNVFLIRRSGNPDYVKLLDFGIAKLLEDSPVKTQTGAVLGTAYYMSPEQCRGASIDHRTDLYALGIVLYQMLVGEVPFHAGNTAGILIKHLTEPCPAPGARVPGLPAELESLQQRLVAKEAAQRWQSAPELQAALEAMLPRLGSLPAPPAPAARTPATLEPPADAFAPTVVPVQAASPPVAAAPTVPQLRAGDRRAKAPLNTLALLGFIFSIFFVVPVLGIAGAVLGIVALARWKPGERGRWLAIAAIPIGVVGVPVALAIPTIKAFTSYTRKAQATSARLEGRRVQQALELHQVQSGETACPASLDVLVKKGLLSALPSDPWGHPYRLRAEGSACRVFSSGPDGLPDTGDDVEIR